jgi:uncharacterized protein (DUF1800 family)
MRTPKTQLVSLALVLTAHPAAALDLNSNGLDDIWEARYQATGLSPGADADGDGQTNSAEAAAGTDPFDPSSRLAGTLTRVDDGAFRLTVSTQPGKKYQLLTSGNLSAAWQSIGEPVLATAASLDFAVPQSSANSAFFRIVASDADGDGDGLTDWAERQLAGFDPQKAVSFVTTSYNDLAIATEMIDVWRNGLTLATPAPIAYEKESEVATLTFTRPATRAYPLTIFLKTSGAADPAKSSAGPLDYVLKDSADQPVVAGRFIIPADAATATLNVQPLHDDLIEVPEQLNFAIGGGPRTATISINDAKNTAANQKLFIAYLHPSPGVESNGGGLATIRVPGDNDTATATVSFSNLNSPVNATHIQTLASATLQSIAAANYGGHTWPIRASLTYTTDQAVLDSLVAGDVKLSVFTEANATGEIEGPFQLVDGSIEFQPPAAPDPVATLTGTELECDIVRFLTQATYGPTEAAIADLKARVASAGGNRLAAYESWIDDQFSGPSVSLLAYTTAANQQEIAVYSDTSKSYYNATFDPGASNRRRGWWLFSLSAPDQLRQRLAFALSEIFVISDVDTVVASRTYGAANYYDLLRTGSDGSFRSLLEAVSKSPMMGQYLSHRGNQKATYDKLGNLVTSPDENFAREVMQLFSIGLVQLHPDGSLKLSDTGSPIPTYGQNDITEMARVFTGWTFSVRNSPSNSDTVIDNTSFTTGTGTARYEAQWIAPMKNFPDKHDVGAKAMIGLSLPAGQTGDKDLSDVIGYLAAHPNTAPFITRRLIQRLVTANPSAGYRYRVSQAFTRSGGNLGATVKAILLDPEARSLDSATTLASSGKAREPILKTTAFFRAFGAKSKLLLADLSAYGYPATELAKFPAGTTRARVSSSTNTTIGQMMLSAPTVFNWFLPDYSPPGLLSANGLVSPELQLANETSIIALTNVLYSPVYSSSGFSTVTALPNQTEAPYNYPANGHNLFADYTALEALYLSILDTNGDGTFTSTDTTTFNNPVKIKAACEAVLDRIDLLLCAGNLKARYADTPGKPRQIILDALAATRATNNSSNNAANQKIYMQDRIKAALWLVASSPEFAVQK